jgi:hypothetical protein
MYHASQVDSCALMMCAPCLLGLIFTLPRAIANASTILTLHVIVIARPADSRLREYIAYPRAGAYADSLATFSSWQRTPTSVQKVRHNGMVHPSSKKAVLPCSPE